MSHHASLSAIAFGFVFVGITTLGGCERGARGAGCREDKDCAKGLECLGGAPADAQWCTTRCSMVVASSCPQGWKCITMNHFSGLNGCVRQ